MNLNCKWFYQWTLFNLRSQLKKKLNKNHKMEHKLLSSFCAVKNAILFPLKLSFLILIVVSIFLSFQIHMNGFRCLHWNIQQIIYVAFSFLIKRREKNFARGKQIFRFMGWNFQLERLQRKCKLPWIQRKHDSRVNTKRKEEKNLLSVSEQ